MIEGPAARDRQHPREQAAARSVELVGAAPQLRVHLLVHVLRVTAIADDVQDHREGRARGELVELGEPLRLAARQATRDAPLVLLLAGTAQAPEAASPGCRRAR